jgi:predicted dinucleotide-binding enzyme
LATFCDTFLHDQARTKLLAQAISKYATDSGGDRGLCLKISIIGTGRVAQALARDFAKNNHEITFGSRNPSAVQLPEGKVTNYLDAVNAGEVVFLAVPHRSMTETISTIGPAGFDGKIVVDVSNVLGPPANGLSALLLLPRKRLQNYHQKPKS